MSSTRQSGGPHAAGPSKSGRRGSSRPAAPRTRGQWLVLALVGCITVGVAYEAQRHIHAFLVAGKSRYVTDKWANGAVSVPSSTALERTLANMTRAVQITPDDPGLQEQLGDLHLVAAEYFKDDLTARSDHLKSALAQYQAALDLRPADPQTWASVAVALHASGEPGERMQQAWMKSLALGPNEGHVWPMLLELALANWATASPEMQTWVQAFFARSTPANRSGINKVAGRYGLRLQVADAESAETPPTAASAPR